MMDTLRRMAGRAKGVPDVGTLFHGMLAELAHRCNFDSRKPASGGSAGGRLLVTWTGTTSWHRCSHLLPSGPCTGPGDQEVSSPTPGTQPCPCQQQLLQHSVLRLPAPSLAGSYCFVVVPGYSSLTVLVSVLFRW